ncbi:MAG: hypothetical protein CMI17_07720 [Opitutaceae bacterium]|nr:hypothetical protein [Opitutaceae bacterium]
MRNSLNSRDWIRNSSWALLLSKQRARKAGPYPSPQAEVVLQVPVAGNTGIGMNQRMQSFVLDPTENPYDVIEPGKRPRLRLTPPIA